MELKPKIQTRQQLALSPRLYQSLKVLRLSAHELQEVIQKELDENPTLEIPEPADFDVDLGRVESEGAIERELWRDLAAAGRDEGAADRRDPMRPSQGVNAAELTASPVTLAEHLTVQLNLARLSPRQHRVALAIIGNLDEDGYLRETAADIAANINHSVTGVEDVLQVVQGFDPPGIAARSLEECLIIQLRQLRAGELARQIVEHHLPYVARGDMAGIARSLHVPVARVQRAVSVIRDLNPSPGSLFDSNPAAAAVIPDVYVIRDKGRIRVLANRELVPSLHVSQLYRQIADSAKKTGSPPDQETADYIKTRIRKASRLIRDIDQRRATVTRVARAIAEAQPEFFTEGPGSLRPLALNDIASKLKVHPSTISRAILDKYMSTPWGIMEFRYFFSAGYAGSGAAGMAATAVKKRLQQLIEDEDLLRPFSDQKLATLLKQRQIPISRRTVAKYREEMSIPPSWDRKRKAARQRGAAPDEPARETKP
ncbi:MAG: RNA polymerase factor sigma-54 [Thermoleophilia bacterium]